MSVTSEVLNALLAAERERCAKIADYHVAILIGHAAADPSGDAMEMAKSIAEAIRNLNYHKGA